MARLTKSQKLLAIIAISLCFFLTEISVGFYTHSLALVADAFHYLNDLISFAVALVALKASEGNDPPLYLSYGYQRATLLGAFFNGVFLLALGVSIFLQAIDRFVSLHIVDKPQLMLITGCVGFALNVVSITILHEHEHYTPQAINGTPTDIPTTQGSRFSRLSAPHHEHRHALNREPHKSEHDLGILGIMLHIMGDAANNIGVIIAGAIIWKTHSPARFYADPAVSVGIALMILLSSIPIIRKSVLILLDSVPPGVDPVDVKFDIEQVPGVLAVHELHLRRLNQKTSIASAHIVVSENESLANFMGIANTVSECFHAYGIHSVTLQPEIFRGVSSDGRDGRKSSERRDSGMSCSLGCRRATTCDGAVCCD